MYLGPVNEPSAVIAVGIMCLSMQKYQEKRPYTFESKPRTEIGKLHYATGHFKW